ncbi:alanine/glycine:cation symporter family protein [Rubritalea marina]|uniref:alanine/glycine:cation symporter family protein n=1 Tax=Rubritalea marina TaxID=361055 RepID=UPI000369A472|nr:alanine/glycine:cation symporter family protein [Rubritalea marina]
MLHRLYHKSLATLITILALSSGAHANETKSVDQAINTALDDVATFLENIVFYAVPVGGSTSLPIVLAILGGTAVFLTIYFKFLNIRGLGLAIRTVKGKYTPDDAPGQITHFQALTAALSATVGLGNIAGVAVAVGLGGPGATFWMILMGLCGMTTKFAECTLGVKYRQFDKEGKTHGGAMYYLRDGLAERGLGTLGKALAIFFAVMCIGGAIGAGNMFQVNQAANQFSSTFGLLQGDKTIYFGVIFAVLVGLVLLGGIKSIARVTSFLVPFMCGIYLLAAFFILLTNASSIPGAFEQIIQGAFSPMAVGGGIIGVLIQGIKRAAFSNEAGIGSAPIAHSAVKTEKPASEGLVALLEPFTDTVVVCTMTALVLVISGTWKIDGITKKDEVALYSSPDAIEHIVTTLPKDHEVRFISTQKVGEATYGEVYEEGEADSPLWMNLNDVNSVAGIQKTSLAFSRSVAWFPQVLSVAVILFAFSTMISWAYYGEQAVNYLFGHDNKVADILYKLGFCIFTVIGSVASIGNVVRVSDAMLFAMVLPNMVGIYFLLPVIRKELEDYRAHAKKVDEEGTR